MNFRDLIRRALKFWQRVIYSIKNLANDLERREWRRYHCGNYTDIDELRCPAHGLEDEPNKIVKLWRWQIRRLAKKGKVWTKYASDLERRRSQ